MKQLWNKRFETMSRDELENIRNSKIQTQLKYCYERSSFYKQAFDEIGFLPEDIKTIENLRKLPIVMDKEIEKNSRDESIKGHGHPYGMHLCVPVEQLLVAKTTGGTTEAPTFTYTFTKNDLERWNEQLARVFWFGGLRPEDIVLYCLTLSGGRADSQIKSAIEYLGALTIEAGAESEIERIFNLADLTKPNVLLATPSLTKYMIEKSKEITGKSIKEYKFEKIFSPGEPGVGLGEVKEKAENAYGAKWFDYLIPCGEGACCSCGSKEYQVMHEVAPEYSIFLDDLVDPQTKQPLEIRNGAIGEIVLTSLDREGVPLIKFASGDLVQVFTEKCACGYPGPGYRMKYIGQADDLLNS